jgi:hypothetical protein
MITSEARIEANRKNAAHSTGPRTDEGKERSRQNSYKHGMTGAGIVLSETDAAEVARRSITFADELGALGDVGHALARLAALNSVRAERGADQQTAALTQRLRQVEADFVAPEGVDEATEAKLRNEAVRIATLDTSKEGILARKYEVAAERGFYKAIKLLRQMEREGEALLKAEENERVDAMMASILSRKNEFQKMDDDFDALCDRMDMPMRTRPANFPQTPAMEGQVDIPMTIGRSR